MYKRQLKVFGKIGYDMALDTIISTDGFNVTTAANSGGVIQVDWSENIGSNATIIWSSTEDGDEPDGGSDDGYQKCFQLTTQSGTSASFTLINDNDKSGTEYLHFIVLDAD